MEKSLSFSVTTFIRRKNIFFLQNTATYKKTQIIRQAKCEHLPAICWKSKKKQWACTLKKHPITARARAGSVRPILIVRSSFEGFYLFFCFRALSCTFLILFLSSESLTSSLVWYSLIASQLALLLSARLIIFLIFYVWETKPDARLSTVWSR